MRSTTPVDYTNLDYDALRAAMLARARESLPEWTDTSDNDLGVLLIDLIAYASDIGLYYQTRIAQNLLPGTADEPDALVRLLRLIGFELRTAAPATTNLRIAVDASLVPPLAIPAGTQFFVALPSGRQLTFETARDISIAAAQLTPPDPLAGNLRYFSPVSVAEGRTIAGESLGTADGSPNQLFKLEQDDVIAGSVRVAVAEPGGTTRWETVETLAKSTPADRHFVVQCRTPDTAIC